MFWPVLLQRLGVAGEEDADVAVINQLQGDEEHQHIGGLIEEFRRDAAHELDAQEHEDDGEGGEDRPDLEIGDRELTQEVVGDELE